MESENKSGNTVRTILAVAVCIVLGGASGFAGGYISGLNNNTVPAVSPTINAQATETASSALQQTTKPSEAQNTAAQGSVADVAAAAADSVVEITTETVTQGSRLQQFVSTGAGSGVIYSSDGLIVTNNHVIDGATKITVRLKNGQSYPAVLLGADAQTDLAVLSIEAEDLSAAVFGSSASLKVGESAVAIGNPLGSLGGTVTDGIISALDREISIDNEVMTLLQTNASINPGNSGGGLFNLSGELVGIVNAKSSGSDIEGIGFAIPIDTVKSIIPDLELLGYVSGRPDTGMTFLEISDAFTAMRYRVSELGVYVYSIRDNSGAYTAGIRAGDLITSVNGTAVSTESDLNRQLHDLKVGSTVSMGYKRDGISATVEFEVSEYIPVKDDKTEAV